MFVMALFHSRIMIGLKEVTAHIFIVLQIRRYNPTDS